MNDLDNLQQQIEKTRLRLAANLTVLIEPSTLAELKQVVIEGATDTKDDVVKQVKVTGSQLLSDFADGVRTKAAENPAAALAIGAGLGWKLWKNPPIASFLVGLGLYGLVSGRSKTAAIAETLSEGVDQTGKKITRAVEQSAKTVSEAADQLHDAGQKAWHGASDYIDERLESLHNEQITLRNSILVGLAGLSVAAAVGLAIQKFRDQED